MASREEIVDYLTEELHRESFSDSSYNGVQFEGGGLIRRVGSAVDSGLSIIERAAAARCDLLVVHHGLFWGGAAPIIGVHRQVVQLLVHRDMTIFASHLPLDAHPRLGNNALLSNFLGLTDLQPSSEFSGRKIGFVGNNSSGESLSEMKGRLEGLDGCREVFSLNFGPTCPGRVCVVTGAGSDALYNFRREGFDTFVTGEPRQSMYHFAKENRLNVLCAGHYATETLGVRAVGEELSKRFKIEHEFIGEPTGI